MVWTRDAIQQQSITQHGELLVANKTTQIHVSGRFPISVIRDKTTVTNGTVTQSGGEYLVATTAVASATAKIETYDRGSYVCGLGAVAEMSIRVPTAPTGQQVGEWYYGDGTNGYGFGVDSTGVYAFYTRASSKTKVYQTAWSVDKLDGTGSSAVTLSLTNGSVFFIDFTWFGYGIVEWGVLAIGPSGRQQRIVCHSYQTTLHQSIDDPNLPLGISVANGTTATAFTVAVGGRSFSIYGVYTPPSRVTTVNRNAYAMTASQNTDQYVMSVRRKSSAGFQAIKTVLQGLNLASGTRDCFVKVVAGGTLATPTWNTPPNTPASETAIEYDSTGAYTAGSGVELFSGYVLGNAAAQTELAAAEFKEIVVTNGVPISIIVQNLTASTGTVRACLRITEDW